MLDRRAILAAAILVSVSGALLLGGAAEQASSSDYVLYFPRNLACTVDAEHVEAIRQELSGLSSPAQPMERAAAYVAVRHTLPDAPRQQVMALARRAIDAWPVVPDVVEHARALALASLLMPDGDQLQWANVAWSFLQQSGGRSLGPAEYRFAQELVVTGQATAAKAIGLIAATYRQQFTLDELRGLANALGQKN